MSDHPVPSYQPAKTLHGVLVEFESPETLLAAAEKVRDAGYTKWDTHTPFPVHGMERAMGLKASILPWIVLGAGLAGLALAIFLTWFGNTYDYSYMISGKPYWSVPAYVPIYFELTVLFSGITAFLAIFALSNLPELYHPLFTSERFKRFSDDRFFLYIEAADKKFEEKATFEFANSLGGAATERVED